MANRAQTELPKVSQPQNNQYKKVLPFLILLIVTLTMITVTFLNPYYMKGQIRSDNNQAVVVRQVNQHFDALAEAIGADEDGNSANLLTNKQTQPIADHIIDYTLGLHWFKFNNLTLAKQILHDIELNIGQGASSDAQLVQAKLKKLANNAPYEVIDTFSLNTITLGANIAVMVLLINIVLLVAAIASLYSLISEMRERFSAKELWHRITAAGMWGGFWLMLTAGVLALIPVVCNVADLAVFGYLIEISSSVFLNFVIVGVIIYVLSAIPWEITSNN
ncbi:hypothetical protein [Lactobacillus sp. ESL0681]|uniref:hypothetical protein n=1 Tax=Lactobacillus sp. ESL0681 TaxID=2983211 RepID=UPI0023F6E3F7|nr:hypothetical protein [Lactobacillus sp. ESL0681]WEV39920.1 hypothetical protein OZX59_06825 [Lactobacillus sp. ESL0681]